MTSDEGEGSLQENQSNQEDSHLQNVLANAFTGLVDKPQTGEIEAQNDENNNENNSKADQDFSPDSEPQGKNGITESNDSKNNIETTSDSPNEIIGREMPTNNDVVVETEYSNENKPEERNNEISLTKQNDETTKENQIDLNHKSNSADDTLQNEDNNNLNKNEDGVDLPNGENVLSNMATNMVGLMMTEKNENNENQVNENNSNDPTNNNSCENNDKDIDIINKENGQDETKTNETPKLDCGFMKSIGQEFTAAIEKSEKAETNVVEAEKTPEKVESPEIIEGSENIEDKAAHQNSENPNPSVFPKIDNILKDAAEEIVKSVREEVQRTENEAEEKEEREHGGEEEKKEGENCEKAELPKLGNVMVEAAQEIASSIEEPKVEATEEEGEQKEGISSEKGTNEDENPNNNRNEEEIEDGNKKQTDLEDEPNERSAENNELENMTQSIIDRIVNDKSHENLNEEEDETEAKENHDKNVNLENHENTENPENNVNQENQENDENEDTAKPGDDQKGDVLITMVESPHHRGDGPSHAETQTEGLYDDYEGQDSQEQDSQEQKQEEGENEDDTAQQEDEIPPIPVARFSPEELQEALQKQLKTQKLPPIEMREELIEYGKKQSLYHIISEDYDTATKIDEAVAANIRSLKDDFNKNDADQQTMQLQSRLEIAQNQQQELEELWKDRIEKFKENEGIELNRIQDRHEQERRAFEENWEKPEALLKFSKPSPSLLQIRRMQKSLAISHDFAKAKQLKRAGDVMQNEESHHASSKAAETMRIAYIQLIEKQNKEIQCFNENSQRRLTQLETKRDADLSANGNLRTQLTTRVNKPKMLKRPTVTVPNVSRGEARRPVTGVITYRTRSQFANYRKSAEKTKLDVKLADVKSIIKPLNKSPRKGAKSNKTSNSLG